MLCGRLPFDDEYIPTLFKKINNGIYSIPPYVSAEAKQLLQSMLVVDPVKRITIAEIRQLPWFQLNLPAYLQPLPPTPAAEPSGFDFGNGSVEQWAEQMRSTGSGGGASSGGGGAGGGGAGAGGSGSGAGGEREHDEAMRRGSTSNASGVSASSGSRRRGLVTTDLGIVEEEIVDELVAKMVGFTREDVTSQLCAQGENQVKVAYQLLRDHQRMVRNSGLEEQKEMQGFLAQSPPPGTPGSSTSTCSARRASAASTRSASGSASARRPPAARPRAAPSPRAHPSWTPHRRMQSSRPTRRTIPRTSCPARTTSSSRRTRES